MTDLVQGPLGGRAIYNPDLLSKEELVRAFVARRPQLDRMVEDLRRVARGGTVQHKLLIGTRGMGKTTLLRRLRYAIDDDAELSRAWLPLTFPEEQYNVLRLSDLYENCLDAMSDALEERGQRELAAKLDKSHDELPEDEKLRAARALELLVATARKLDRRLVLLVDNVELLFERLKDRDWELRELLSSQERILLVGASATVLEETYKYEAAFYDFFQIHQLESLSEAECRELLIELSRMLKTPAVERIVTEHPSRLRSLHVLTGGNPRTMVLLHGVLAESGDGDVRSDLERLLDQCTPFYKARFEALPAQSQQIVDALALHWHPIGAGELAEKVRLDPNAVSSQLSRLGNQGIVAKVPYDPESRTGFQVAERFFNIWYLMRASRRTRRKLVWLVEFLKLFYEQDELVRRATGLFKAQSGGDYSHRLRRAEFGFALADAIQDVATRRAVEGTSMRILVESSELRDRLGELFDLDGADASLKPIADRQQAAAEIRRRVLAAKVALEDWDAERFADLLGGNPFQTLGQKLRLAKALSDTDAETLGRWTSYHEATFSIIRDYLGERPARVMARALKEGHVDGMDDSGALAAAEIQLGAPWLRAMAAYLPVSNARAMPAEERERLLASLSDDADSWLFRGLLLQLNRETRPEAEAAYRRAIELDPTGGAAYINLASLLELRQDTHGSEIALRKGIEVDPNQGAARGSLADLLLRHGRPHEAAEEARRAIERQTGYPQHWIVLAKALIQIRSYTEAEQAARTAIRLLETAEAWSLVGDALIQLSRHEEGLDSLRRAVELDPASALAWGTIGLYTPDDAEAVVASSKAVDLQPGNPGFLIALLSGFVRQHKWTEARGVGSRFFALDPSDSLNLSAGILMVALLANAGRSRDVRELLDEAELPERWQPLREAVLVLEEGSRLRLRRLAPEMRVPTEQILEQLASYSKHSPLEVRDAAKPSMKRKRAPVARARRRKASRTR